MPRSNTTKSTSRTKTQKSPVKRSAPIPAQPERPIGGEGGWAIIPTSSALGLTLIDRRKRAQETFDLLIEFGSNLRAERADEAMDSFGDSLSYIPPRGPIEALAAALLIQGDLDMIQAGSDDRLRREAAARLVRRAAGIAYWIESTHKVSREEFGLGGVDLYRLIPQEAALIDANPSADG